MDAPATTRVEAFVAHARGSSAAELLAAVRENPASLVVDTTRELRTFRVAATTTLGSKSGRGRGAFIDSVLAGLDVFYADVLRHLRAWTAAPPKLRKPQPPAAEVDDTVPAALASTDYSSQYDAQPNVPDPAAPPASESSTSLAPPPAPNAEATDNRPAPM